jgi:hypothetical protein
MPRELGALAGTDGAVADQIALVADEQLADFGRRDPLGLAEPGPDGVEGLPPRDVVDDNNAVCAVIVRRRDRVEPLLPRGVPDLELDLVRAECDRFDLLELECKRQSQRRSS